MAIKLKCPRCSRYSYSIRKKDRKCPECGYEFEDIQKGGKNDYVQKSC